MSGQPNVYTSSALETTALVTGSSAVANPVRLLGMIYENTSNATGWVQVFDAFAQPSNGAKPLVSIKLSTVSQSSVDFPVCLPCKNGITVVLSSTGPTYTAVNSALFVTAFWTN